MIKEKTIYYNNRQIFKMFNDSFGPICDLARSSENSGEFKQRLKAYIQDTAENSEDNRGRAVAAKRILRLIEHDDTFVDELSTSERIHIKTITYLWELLSGRVSEKVFPDLSIDLYHQFRLQADPPEPTYTLNRLKRAMDRFPSGLNSDIVAQREANKARIIEKLIDHIDHHSTPQSKYRFEPQWEHPQKRQQVEAWWQNAGFHLAMAIKSPTMLNAFLGHTLSDETMRLLGTAKKKGMPFFITPYYLSLLCTDKSYDDSTIRSYILYSQELVDTYGSIRAWEKEDTIVSGEPNAAGWLLPDGNNIHRRYPEVAILIPDSMGRACGGLCASCQRMYDFQSQRFNFDLEALKPKEGWPKKLERLMRYFEEDSQLRDILITGGDAFMSRNATLKNILDAVYAMAVRKRKANTARADGEKFAELQRVRLGSRLPAYLPMRINDELVGILRDFRAKASRIGVSQFIIQTHFQSPLEITPEAMRAIEAIISSGWVITNQLVYNVAASRRGHTAKLRRMLNRAGVVCYYTFSVKGFQENYAVFTPNSRSLQEQCEEKAFGLMSPQKQGELYQLLTGDKPSGRAVEAFLRRNDILFAATDRNVLNLPAIGKSMSFQTVGITHDGKRILRFKHDASRRHSPIIDTMPDIYIVENKSIAAYLRQLEQLKENAADYDSIWSYTEGVTEPRFELYRYPDYPFAITSRITNVEQE